MERLSGLDAACLHIETPATPMNVMAVVRLDGSEGGFERERFLAQLESRMGDLAPLRRRLVDSVLGLDRPHWVECRDVHLLKHVSVITAPAPGGERQFAEIVAGEACRPLDRSRPLWRLTIVEGLEQAQVGLVMVIHHAAVDGISGAALLARVLDCSPDPHAPPAVKPASARRDGTREHEFKSPGTRPSRVAEAVTGVAAAAERFGHFASGPGRSLLDPTPFAPETRLTGRVGADRIVAWCRTRRNALEFVRKEFGGTLNDVVMAACTESLRHYLRRHDELPDQPLVAAVPISVRQPGEHDRFGNRLSALFMRLPVHIDDPVEQLTEIQHESRRAKQVHHAVGGDTLGYLAELTSDGILGAGVRIAEMLGVTRWLPPLANVTISNVPGPREPLYAAGARVISAHPHGPLLAGVRLNITVMSYADSVDFGLIGCRQSLPDADEVARGFGNAIDALVKLALGEVRSQEVTDSPAGA